MKMKNLGTCALALAMAAAICVPCTAFAAGLDDGTTSADKTAAGTTPSVITGTIKATTLSVSVPTAAAFNVDPGATAAANGGQFSSPTNYTITNKSVVPVYAHVSAVAANKVALVSAKGDVKAATTAGGDDAKIQFAVKDAAPTNFDTADDWLTTATTKYFAFNATNKGKLDAKDGANASATMKFYGQVAPENWTEEQTFTVTPTFTIATTAVA